MGVPVADRQSVAVCVEHTDTLPVRLAVTVWLRVAEGVSDKLCVSVLAGELLMLGLGERVGVKEGEGETVELVQKDDIGVEETVPDTEPVKLIV